jgi:hypothetical protein
VRERAIALLNGNRVEAAEVERGPEYYCPNCRGLVTLKKGRIVTHHFAHKPPTDCSWAAGETQQHLAAKKMLRDALRTRGFRAEVEVEVISIAGDRRADVVAWGKDNVRLAFEIQHQSIPFQAIETRTKAYIATNVPVIWLGIADNKIWDAAEPIAGGKIVHRYSVRPWEKWAHAYAMGQLWFIDEQGALWRGKLSPHQIHVESTSWYNPEGEEQSAGGYSRYSKRWKELRLYGPYSIATVRFASQYRKPFSSKYFSVPGGRTYGLAPP